MATAILWLNCKYSTFKLAFVCRYHDKNPETHINWPEWKSVTFTVKIHLSNSVRQWNQAKCFDQTHQHANTWVALEHFEINSIERVQVTVDKCHSYQWMKYLFIVSRELTRFVYLLLKYAKGWYIITLTEHAWHNVFKLTPYKWLIMSFVTVLWRCWHVLQQVCFDLFLVPNYL